MACPTITLSGVTAEVWGCLRAQATRIGVVLPAGDSGAIRHADADADFAWDPASGTLSVTFTRTPAWIGCAMLESRLRQAAASCGAR